MGLWEVYSDIESSLFGFVQHPIPPWRDIAIEDDIMPPTKCVSLSRIQYPVIVKLYPDETLQKFTGSDTSSFTEPVRLSLMG
jgi:hypothetical protein